MQKYAKPKYAKICKYTIGINMHKICIKYAKSNMHKYSVWKYTEICDLYA